MHLIDSNSYTTTNMKHLFLYICLLFGGALLAQNTTNTTNDRPQPRVVTQNEVTVPSDVIAKISSLGKVDSDRMHSAKIITKNNALPASDILYKRLFEDRSKTIRPIIVTKNSPLTVKDPKILQRIMGSTNRKE